MKKKKSFAVLSLPGGIALSSAAIAFASISMSHTSSTRYWAQSVSAQSVSTNIFPIALPSLPLNAAKPEKALRSFVAALNANRFEDAARYVDGAQPRANYKPLRELFAEENPNFSILSLSVSTRGDKAVARVKFAFKGRTTKRTQNENISLVRRGARWLVVPTKMDDASARSSIISSLATMIQSPQTMTRAREAARRASCFSNLKQIALAAIMLAQDDEKLAITPQNFKTKLFTYSKTMQIFRCPSVASGESYSFNGNLTNLDMSKLSPVTASQLVMFYEGKNGKLDFRHLGLSNVAFVDGHVKSIGRNEAQTLRWKP